METTKSNTVQQDPQQDWQSIKLLSAHDTDDPDEGEDEDENEDENEDEDEYEKGDWGHVDPAESNGPFPDSNAPGFPGSAV